MSSYSAFITSDEVSIAGGKFFKMATSRFVDVSQEEINLMKENAISRNVSVKKKQYRSDEGLTLET